jgi:hypothetical protein
MSSLLKKYLVVVILVLLPLSCAKLPEWSTPGKGIAVETLPANDSIPLKWGNLVSAQNSPNMQYLFQLWFQDEQGNLRLVFYDVRSNILMTNVRHIPRR